MTNKVHHVYLYKSTYIDNQSKNYIGLIANQIANVTWLFIRWDAWDTSMRGAATFAIAMVQVALQYIRLDARRFHQVQS